MSIDTATLARVLYDISNDEVMRFSRAKQGERDVRRQLDDDNRITVILVAVGSLSN